MVGATMVCRPGRAGRMDANASVMAHLIPWEGFMRRSWSLMVVLAVMSSLVWIPGASAAEAEVELLGAWGCSQTDGAMTGYNEIGGTNAWTNTKGLGGGALSNWVKDDVLWGKWDSMIASNPGTTDIWWNICLLSRSGADPDPTPDDFVRLETVYNEIRDRLPSARLWVSPINGFDPENCSLSGPSADIVSSKLADWAVSQGWAQRGFDPVVLTPSMVINDGCHPNEAGRAAFGQQIADFFFDGDLPSGSFDGTFSDDDGNVHEGMIEAIAAAGITSGCSASDATLFCPNDFVSRGQMASFLARALELPPSTTDFFVDDDGDTHEDNINRIAAANITLGIGNNLYDPLGVVTRAQMASFLARAYNLDATTVDFFTDDDGGIHEDNINRIAAANITLGIGNNLYDPLGVVTRAQMASFLGRAEGLAEIFPS
ncbi:MAG TPA: hypothetical protein ENH15_02070 [Actinobacteria bacterium]|nr:hypothetical protein [Actinomycetota bacterium]